MTPQHSLFDATDFYPTPDHLIGRMLATIPDWRYFSSFLEPSAGNGNIAEYIRRSRDNYNGGFRIDCIELNPDLQMILRGKEFPVIHDDFRSFQTRQQYDLIIANFPFSDGLRHLDRALMLLVENGGWLVCLINAATLNRGPAGNQSTIDNRLKALGAKIEIIPDAFRDAERQASVDVAMITVHHDPCPAQFSILLNNLKESEYDPENAENITALAEQKNFISLLIDRFNLEAKLGRQLIREYYALKPFMVKRIPRKEEDKSWMGDLIELQIEDKSYHKTAGQGTNAYLEGLRHKYWQLLLHPPRLRSDYTSNILKDLDSMLTDLRHYDFTEFNIRQLEADLRSKISLGIEDAILKMFEDFSRKFAYDESIQNGNIHYYNGWKSNKAWKINDKIVLPMNGLRAIIGGDKWQFDYYIKDRIHDIVKVFNYLSEKKGDPQLIVGQTMSEAEAAHSFSGMDMRFFKLTFYKKGTAHIRFTDPELLAKFNIFGSQRKGWLPPSYGRKAYDDMPLAEQVVIDEFQGREEYEKVMKRPEYYIVDPSQLRIEGEASDEA